MRKATRDPIRVHTAVKQTQIFDENVIPPSKANPARKVNAPTRTALGELTNTLVERIPKKETSHLPSVLQAQKVPLARKNETRPKVSYSKVTSKPIVAKVPANHTSNASVKVTSKTPYLMEEEIDDTLTVSFDKHMDLMELDKSFDSEEEIVDENETEDPIADIDAGDEDDPQFCSEYVQQIMNYCKIKEVFILILGD